MRYLQTWAVLLLGLLLLACSPGLNWRDVRPQQAPLLALFPCKPDAAERSLPLGDKEVLVKMLVCEADGALFTLASTDVKSASKLGETLDLWRKATLTQMKAGAVNMTPFALKGALPLPQALKVVAKGSKPDGSTLTLHAAWFAVGTTVYQAAVYFSRETADANGPVAETYFSGLRFQ